METSATCEDSASTESHAVLPRTGATQLLPQTEPVPIETNGSELCADVFRCLQCPSRVYRSNAALNVHRRTIHGVLDYPNQSVPCQEPSCSVMTHSVSELRSHLVKDHGLQLKKIDSEFPNMKAFTRWKSQVEASECVCFIAKKSKNLPLERQHYYYCQRSWACRNGGSNSKSARTAVENGLSLQNSPPSKRKSTGVNETDGTPKTIYQLLPEPNDKGYVHCTAQLTVREDLRSGRVLVTGCLTHYAHSMTSRHFIEAIHRRSRVGRLKEGGVAGQEAVDISSVESRLLAIYELAATKKKQKSVDKIQAALQDLFDCLKDYDEDDETLPGLEETRAWRQSAAQEEAERERSNRCQKAAGQSPSPNSATTNASLSIPSIAGAERGQISIGKSLNGSSASSGADRESSSDGHLWAFQGEGVVVTTIAHG